MFYPDLSGNHCRSKKIICHFMSLTYSLLLISVVYMVCRGQEGSYQFGSTKRVKQGTLLKAKCIYKLSEATSEVEFDIGFDSVTKKFKVRNTKAAQI